MNDNRLDYLLDYANKRIYHLDKSDNDMEKIANALYTLIEDCLKNATEVYGYINNVSKYDYLGKISSCITEAPNSYYVISDDQIVIYLNYSIEFNNYTNEAGELPDIKKDLDYLRSILDEKGITIDIIEEKIKDKDSQGIIRLLKVSYTKNKELTLKR